MKMKLFSAALLAISCMGVALVQPAHAAAGWTNFGAITEFNQNPPTTPGNEALFFRATVTVNPSGCSQVDGFYMQVNTELQKRLFAMLMTAKAAGQRVSVYVTGACHLWGYAELQGLTIE